MSAPTLEDLRNAAGRLGQVAEIQAIVLRGLHWTTNETPFDPQSDAPQVEPSVNVSHGRSDALLRYQIQYIATGKVPNGELFRMESAHEAFFQLPDGEDATELEITAFGIVSVYFMVFPYVREVLHRLTGNAGFPPILLRPLRIPFNPADGQPHSQLARTSDH